MGVSAKAIDFSGVKDRSGFNTARVTEGDYEAIVTNVEDAEVKDTKEFQYLFTIKLVKFSQNKYPYYCKLQENQLWKLRNLLIAAGINVPKKRMKVDPTKVVGRKIGVSMGDDEYNGRLKSVITAVFPVSELGEGTFAPGEDTDVEGDADPNEDVMLDGGAESAGGKKKKGKKAKKSEAEELDLEDL